MRTIPAALGGGDLVIKRVILCGRDLTTVAVGSGVEGAEPAIVMVDSLTLLAEVIRQFPDKKITVEDSHGQEESPETGAAQRGLEERPGAGP